MPIPIICPCSAKLKVNDRLKGQHIQCPKCGAIHPVGGANGSLAVPPALAPPADTPAAPPAPAPRAPAAPADTAAALSQSDLSESDRALLEQQLESGEGVVWAGKPAERLAFLAGLVATAAFGLVGLVLLIVLVVWLLVGSLHGLGLALTVIILGLIIVAFVAAGVGWPFWARHRARRTVYAITTRRALGWDRDLFGRFKLHIYEPAAVAGVKPMIFGQGPDAAGHLIFRAGVVTDRIAGIKLRYYRRWGFFNLQHAREVERVLRETLIDPFLEQTYDQKEGG